MGQLLKLTIPGLTAIILVKEIIIVAFICSIDIIMRKTMRDLTSIRITEDMTEKDQIRMRDSVLIRRNHHTNNCNATEFS
jgi:hypothetical protein